MRHLTTTLCLTVAVLLGSAGESFALSKCSGSYNEITWTNCFGTISVDGNKYVGEFKDGKFHGQGTFTFASGSKYVGAYKDGKRHGQGTWTFANGNKYVGEFKDGKFHGQGTFAYANGSKYVGAYKDGKRHGQGTVTFANGNKYVGEFKDGKSHGQGTVTFANGNKYVGEFKDGKFHGQGTLTYANGGKYVGEHKNGKRHGQGTLTYANGDKYVGEHKDGMWHGQGTRTYANGRIEEGIWENDKFLYAKKVTPTVTARKPPKIESGKGKLDWWTAQQAKHKTGTRYATTSSLKPIAKAEFAHKYPKLESERTVVVKKTPKIESGKGKLDWWTAQQAKHKTGTRDATTSSLKPIAKAEFAHKYPKLKSERTVVVKKTPKIESKRNVSKGTSIAGNLGNAIRDNSELLKFSLEYPNLTATQIIARFPEKAKKLLRAFYENYLDVSKCHESSTKYISNSELNSAKKEMRKKEKLFKRKMDTDRIWNSAVRVFEQGSIFSGPPAGWQKMAVIYSKDAHFWCNQQYQFLMSYWDTPTAKKGIRKKDF